MVKDDENLVNFIAFRKKAREAEKLKARSKKEFDANINRIRFGRTGAEKSLLRSLNKKDAEKLDAHRRDGAKPPTKPGKK